MHPVWGCSKVSEKSYTQAFWRMLHSWPCCTTTLDKSEGKEFSGQFDEAWGTLKDYSDCLGIEVSERVNLSTMLASCLAHQARELARVQEDVKVGQAF